MSSINLFIKENIKSIESKPSNVYVIPNIPDKKLNGYYQGIQLRRIL